MLKFGISMEINAGGFSRGVKVIERGARKITESTKKAAKAQKSLATSFDSSSKRIQSAVARVTGAMAKMRSSSTTLKIATKQIEGALRSLSASTKKVSSNVTRANSSIKKFTTSSERMSRATTALGKSATSVSRAMVNTARSVSILETRSIAAGASINKVTGSVGHFQRSANRLKNSAKGAARAMSAMSIGAQRVGRASRRMGSSVKSATSSVKRFSSAIKIASIALAAFAAARVISSISKAGREIERISRTLKVVTGSSNLAAKEFAFVREEAERLGLNLSATAVAYSKLAIAAKGGALEGQGVRDVFSGVAEAITVMGLSAEDSRLIFFALQQMVSKNVISAEELRRQMGERLPVAISAMAAGIGVSVKELSKMLEKGELLATEVLPGFARELKKLSAPSLEAALKSTQAQFNRLSTAIFETKGEVAKGLNPALSDLAGTLARIGSTDDAKTFFEDMGKAMGLVGKAVDVFIKKIDKITPAWDKFRKNFVGGVAIIINAVGSVSKALLLLEARLYSAVARMIVGIKKVVLEMSPLAAQVLGITDIITGGLDKAAEGLKEHALKAFESYKVLDLSLGIITSTMLDFASSAAVTREKLDSTLDSTNNLTEGVKELTDAEKKAAEKARKLAEAAAEAAREHARLLAILFRSISSLEAEADAAERGAFALSEFRKEAELAAAAAAAFDEALEHGATMFEAIDAATRTRNAISRIFDAEENIEQMEIMFDRYQELAEAVIGGVVQGLVNDLFDNGKIDNFWDHFKNAGLDVINILTDALIRSLTQQIALNLVAGNGVTGGSGFTNLFKSAATSALKQYFGAASGATGAAGISASQQALYAANATGGGGATAASLASGGGAAAAQGGRFANIFNNVNWANVTAGIAAAVVVIALNELNKKWKAERASESFTSLRVSFGQRSPSRDQSGFFAEAPNEYLSGLSDSREFSDSIAAQMQALVDSMGGVVEAFSGFQIKLREDGKEFIVAIGDIERSFDDFSEAVNFAIVDSLSKADISGLGPNMQLLLEGLKGAAKSVEEIATEGIPLAQLLDGLDGVITVNPFDSLFKSIETSGFDLLRLAEKWGLDLTAVAKKIQGDLDDARRSITDKILDLEGAGGLREQAQVYKDLAEQAKLFNEAAEKSKERLSEFGDAVKEIGEKTGPDQQGPGRDVIDLIDQWQDFGDEVSETIHGLGEAGRRTSIFVGDLEVLEHELDDVGLAAKKIDLDRIEAAAELFRKGVLSNLIGDYGRLLGDQESIVAAQQLAAEIELITLRTRIAQARLELDLTVAQDAVLARMAERIDEIIESGNIPVNVGGGGGNFGGGGGGGSGGYLGSQSARLTRRNEIFRQFFEMGVELQTGIQSFTDSLATRVEELRFDLEHVGGVSADIIEQFIQRFIDIERLRFIDPFQEEVTQSGENEFETRRRHLEEQSALELLEAQRIGITAEQMAILLEAQQLRIDALNAETEAAAADAAAIEAETAARRDADIAGLFSDIERFGQTLGPFALRFAEVEEQAAALQERAEELGIEIEDLADRAAFASRAIGLDLLSAIQAAARDAGVAAPELEILGQRLVELQFIMLRADLAAALMNQAFLEMIDGMGIGADYLFGLIDDVEQQVLQGLGGSGSSSAGAVFGGGGGSSSFDELARLREEMQGLIQDLLGTAQDLDPYTEEINRVTERVEDFVARLVAAGGSAAEAAALYDALAIAIDNITDSALDNLREYRDELGRDNPSFTPRQRIEAALAAFQEQASLALSGDLGAQAGLAGYIQDLLSAAGALGTAGGEYQDILALVQHIMDQLLGDVDFSAGASRMPISVRDPVGNAVAFTGGQQPIIVLPPPSDREGPELAGTVERLAMSIEDLRVNVEELSNTQRNAAAAQERGAEAGSFGGSTSARWYGIPR